MWPHGANVVLDRWRPRYVQLLGKGLLLSRFATRTAAAPWTKGLRATPRGPPAPRCSPPLRVRAVCVAGSSDCVLVVTGG